MHLAIRLARERHETFIELRRMLGEMPGEDKWAFMGNTTRTVDASALAARARELLGISREAQSAWQTEYAALNTWKRALEDDRWSHRLAPHSR